MKNTILLAILLVAVGIQANAQKNVIKFNPLPLILGTAELDYERVVTGHTSFQIELGYTTLNFESSDGEKDNYDGFSIGAQYRFYLQEKYEAPQGWFGAPYIGYSAAKYNDEDLKYNVFSIGGVIGYQWQLSPVAIDLYFGPGYFNRNADDSSFDVGFNGLGLKAGFAIGIAF